MITIIQSNDEKGYWINGKYVLTENWEISKLKFTEAEQKQFLKHINNNNMQHNEIEIQQNLIAQYEEAGNSIAVAFHKAILKRLTNNITVINPVLVS